MRYVITRVRNSGIWVLFISFLIFQNVEPRNVFQQKFDRRIKSPHIINGEEASLGQFPWQVAIYFTSDRETWWCGGIIISEKWILTAAHCLSYVSGSIYAGLIDLYDPNSVFTPITGEIRHEDFDQHTLKNDIALLEMPLPLVFNDNIRAIDLSSEDLQSGVDIVVSGWGQKSDDDTTTATQVLNYATLSTIDNDECDKIYGGGTIVDGMVCAVSKTNITKAICFGDTGGPAVVYNNGTPVLVAISSFISDRGCESGDPSGFSRVNYYREWIRQNAGI